MVMFREEARRSRRPIGPVPRTPGRPVAAPITALPSASNACLKHPLAAASLVSRPDGRNRTVTEKPVVETITWCA